MAKTPEKKIRATSAHPKVNSVVHALATLRVVAASNHPLGVTEIAREIDINLSSCFNILKTLVAEGFLTFDSLSKKYTLGSGALELSNRTHDAHRLFNDVRPQLTRLATTHKLTVGFWEIRDARLLLTGVVDSDAVIRIQMIPGQRLPLGSGAMGRVIASAQGLRGKELMATIENVNWYRLPSERNYTREVTQTDRTGWAVDSGHFIGGVMTIASAILAGPHDPRYCLAVSGFVGQYEDAEIEEIGRATHETALAIQQSWFGFGAELPA
jgi:DNA-binding IclR family transcriptional regulator